MAEGTEPRPEIIFTETLASNSSTTFNGLSRMAMILARRGTAYYVGLVDLWNTDTIIISASGSILSVTHEALSSTITISNISANSLPIMIISY